MRLRNVKNKEKILESCDILISESKEIKGNWRNVFESDNPIYIEIGMGKGNFIIENALKDVEILKYHRDGNILIEEIDIKGYLENIEKQKYINKCEKIKNNILNENKYENFQNDFCVDEEQLDKVKIKIKKLNRDL